MFFETDHWIFYISTLSTVVKSSMQIVYPWCSNVTSWSWKHNAFCSGHTAEFIYYCRENIIISRVSPKKHILSPIPRHILHGKLKLWYQPCVYLCVCTGENSMSRAHMSRHKCNPKPLTTKHTTKGSQNTPHTSRISHARAEKHFLFVSHTAHFAT